MTNSRSNPNALIIGAGVSGLTTALCLHRRGIRSTILAEKFAPQVTSNVAGALWEWPPGVCGHHQDQKSLDRSKNWSMVSYRKFEELAGIPGTGVYLRPSAFFFRNKVEDHVSHLRKMNELRDKVRGFVHDPGLIQQTGANQNIGLKDAYSYIAPMVDTDTYMEWLMREVKTAGSAVVEGKVEGDLKSIEQHLKRKFRADVVINCAGLGSKDLTDDEMYPLRGALVRLVNDGTLFPKVTRAYCVSRDDVTGDQDIVFIVPRGEDRIVLGALVEPDQWSTDINWENYEPIRRMYQRCLEFLPVLARAPVDAAEPVRVGLRPFRKQSVRLEHVPGTSIVHNYGHGGSGVTFSWGCAAEVAEIVAQQLAPVKNPAQMTVGDFTAVVSR
jgi:D-amino-acid oxidase